MQVSQAKVFSEEGVLGLFISSFSYPHRRGIYAFLLLLIIVISRISGITAHPKSLTGYILMQLPGHPHRSKDVSVVLDFGDFCQAFLQDSLVAFLAWVSGCLVCRYKWINNV